jgi:DNA-binding NtrC family response regulator
MSKATPRILLVDDEPLALKCIGASLAAEGLDATIYTAPSVERAKELFVAYAPQVVITDLCIEPSRGPSSGYEFLCCLKKLSSLPFRTVVLTGFDDSKNGIRALELGAAHFITKPPDPHHLKIIVEDAITQSNILREKKSIEENLLENSTLIGGSEETT